MKIKVYLKQIWNWIVQSFQSIGDSLNVFDPPSYRNYVAPKLNERPKYKTIEDALRADWEAIGGDMRKAIKQVDKELREQKETQHGRMSRNRSNVVQRKKKTTK